MRILVHSPALLTNRRKSFRRQLRIYLIFPETVQGRSRSSKVIDFGANCVRYATSY